MVRGGPASGRRRPPANSFGPSHRCTAPPQQSDHSRVAFQVVRPQVCLDQYLSRPQVRSTWVQSRQCGHKRNVSLMV